LLLEQHVTEKTIRRAATLLCHLNETNSRCFAFITAAVQLELKIQAPALAPTSKTVSFPLQKDLVHAKLKTIVGLLYVQLACPHKLVLWNWNPN